MSDPKTMDELFQLSHRLVFGQVPGEYRPINHYPGSNSAQKEESDRELIGSRAGCDVQYCPYAELVSNCVKLVGIDPRTLLTSDYYCGLLYHPIGSWARPSIHNIDPPRAYAACEIVCGLLGAQLKRFLTERPSEVKLSNILRLPKEERDQVLAEYDASQEALHLHEQFTIAIRSVGATPGTSKEGLANQVQMYMGLLGERIGWSEGFMLISSCPQAPKRSLGREFLTAKNARSLDE